MVEILHYTHNEIAGLILNKDQYSVIKQASYIYTESEFTSVECLHLKEIHILVLKNKQEESARERALCQLTECF